MSSSGSGIRRFLASVLLLALFGTVAAGTSEARNAPAASRSDSFGSSGVPLRSASGMLLSKDGFGVYTVSHYRRIEADDELQSDLFTGGLVFAYQPSPALMTSGGIVGELSDGVAPFNAGTIESAGVGLALAASYRMTDAFSVTGGVKTFFGTGDLRPFAEADVRYTLNDDFGLPAGVVLVNDAGSLAALVSASTTHPEGSSSRRVPGRT